MSQHANEAKHGTEKQSKTSMSASFWLIIILVFLFIAALNFVEVESKGGEGEKTEETIHPVESQKEATANETMKGETGIGKSEGQPKTEAAAADTAKH